MDKNKKILFLFLVVFLTSLLTLLYFVSPEEIVSKIGVHNGYLLVFLVSLFGGFSGGGAISFYSVLLTLVAGGLNPLHLGLISGVSLALGDVFMFYLASRGRELLTGKWDVRIEKVAKVFESKRWLKQATPAFAYLYMSLAPLPNDIIVIFLAAIKFPYRKMIFITILGDITFSLLLAFFGFRVIMAF